MAPMTSVRMMALMVLAMMKAMVIMMTMVNSKRNVADGDANVVDDGDW